MEIHTERLIIREFTPKDLEAVHEYASDPEVVRYMPFGPNTVEDSQNFLDRAIGRQKEEGRNDFEMAVELREGGRLIGGCRLNKTSTIAAHIGYIFNKEYWGRGYATEVAKALVRHGFTKLGVHRIYATCEPDNIASKRVLEKAGMVLEGRLREDMICHGEYRDSLILGILEQEWKES